MADGGWISKYAFQDDALSADTLGRAAMADNYIQANHLDDGIITLAHIAAASMFATGVYGSSRYGNALYG